MNAWMDHALKIVRLNFKKDVLQFYYFLGNFSNKFLKPNFADLFEWLNENFMFFRLIVALEQTLLTLNIHFKAMYIVGEIVF